MDRELLQALAQAGLSGQEYAMVLALLAQGNPAVLPPAELSALTGIPKSHIANVRAKLEARGIISYSRSHRYAVSPPPWREAENSPKMVNSPNLVKNSPKIVKNSPNLVKNSPKMVKMNLGQKNPKKVGSTSSDSFSPNLVNFPPFMSTKGAGYIRYSNMMMMMMMNNNNRGETAELAQLGFLDAEEFVARYGWEKVAKAMEFVNQWNPRNPGAALRFVLERGGPPRARPRWAKYFRGRYGSQLRLLENLSGEAVDGPEGGQVPGAVPQVP